MTINKAMGILAIILFNLSSGIAFAQQKYENGHNTWNPDSLGNHRAVIQVSKPGNAIKAVLPWRLQHRNNDTEIIVTDAKSNRRILNVKTENISREKGTVLFEPVSGAGLYYIYYLPYQLKSSQNYPQAVYEKLTRTASAAWLKNSSNALPAKLIRFEAINAMNSFYPMEVTATRKEVTNLIKSNSGKNYLVFPEDRLHPIKMKNDLPQRWIRKGAVSSFKDIAGRGENFSFQLGIYPVLKDLENVTLTFSALKDAKNHTIPAEVISCLNTNGTNWDGTALRNTVNIKKGDVQSLWCLVNIPQNTIPATYRGTVTVHADHAPSSVIRVSITVNNKRLADGGINEPWKQTRLTWLNSKMAQENDLIKPYLPLQLTGDTIRLLGRKITLSPAGFPAQIQTFFTPEMTGLTAVPKNIITEPIHFHITNSSGHKDIKFKNGGVTFTEKKPGTVKWRTVNTSDELQMQVDGTLEFDGFMSYVVKISALQDLKLDDIKLHIPFTKESSKYLMGLGNKGGYRPDTVKWTWDVAAKNQDGAWIGDVNAGLQYSLRDEKYIRPLNTNFYLQKPLVLPSSWGNNGKGGILITWKGTSMLSENYSGKREMKKGDVLYYNFTMLVTPFHPLDTDFQWKNREKTGT